MPLRLFLFDALGILPGVGGRKREINYLAAILKCAGLRVLPQSAYENGLVYTASHGVLL
jgi:hypothetical protein